jgi:hypothetical protein
MHAGLSSRRGCSQILFLGTLSRHVHSITLRLAMWCGCDPEHKGKVDRPTDAGHRHEKVEKVSYVRALDGGFSLQ